MQIIEGDTYQQLQVSQGTDAPDPRISTPKIIFDSRLDQFSTTEQTKAYIKANQQELKPYTIDDKKKLLRTMLGKKDDQSKPVVGEDQVENDQQEKKSGF